MTDKAGPRSAEEMQAWFRQHREARSTSDTHDQHTAPDDSFWIRRPVLAHVRQFAQARMVSPWATLGVVLARVVAATPPMVVLPATIGGFGSLNVFVALVGPSGSGKGAASAVAREAVDIAGGVYAVNVGSGEGLSHTFVKREKGDLVRINDTALINIQEIDSLTSLATRSSSTILSELRKAWSGEDLGFQYADPTKRLVVEAHTYRMTLVAGVQPQRAEALLNDADGGTPQRFLWLPATDPDAPDQEPEAPEPWIWKSPVSGVDTFGFARLQPLVTQVFDGAVHEIREQRRAQNRGEGDPLDGHRLQCKLKAAAALAILDGRTDVMAEDWELADVVMAKSQQTRNQVQEALAEAARETGNRRAVAAGIADSVREQTKDERDQDRVFKLLLRHLPVALGEEFNRSELRKRLPARDRERFDDAFQRLELEGRIVAMEPPTGVPRTATGPHQWWARVR